MDAEIIIVGAGIFGLSTAYHLAQRTSDPSRIIVLDRATPPSQSAASTDLNKIVRADYSNRLYTELGLEAIEAWQNNPIFKDGGVYHQTGWIMCDERGSDLGQRIRKNFQAIGIDPMQELSEHDVRQNWGGVLKDADLSPFGSFYWNPLAGWADAGRALELLAREIEAMGVRYVVGEAERLIVEETGVQGVETKAGDKLTAEKVLLCTGAWTSALMTSTEDVLRIANEDRVEVQMTAAGVCVAHVQLSEEERLQYDRLPVYVYGGQENQTDAPKGLRDECINAIQARLPQILSNSRQIDYYRLCWDAITPDQHPLITPHPHPLLSNLYLAAGGSFHCWKFLPTIGKYVANVLAGISNGADRDAAWAWKSEGTKSQGGVHSKLRPGRELGEIH
ncbi:unnamed protein product [Penicillium manginii]